MAAGDAPVTRRAFRRFWLLIATAYALGALGLIIAIAMLQNQADTLRDQNDRLENSNQVLALAAGAYCVAGRLPDSQEPIVIHKIAVGEEIRPFPRDCKLIVLRIEQAGE